MVAAGEPLCKTVQTVSDTHARALRRAADLVGDERTLANLLGYPLDLVHKWLTGVTPPPLPAFLAAVDVIMLHERFPKPAKNAIRFAERGLL